MSNRDILQRRELEVRAVIAAAKLALIVEEADAKVDEYLKVINDGKELMQKIEALLRAYNAGRN